LPVFGSDYATFAGEFLVQPPQVKRAVGFERLVTGSEWEPGCVVGRAGGGCTREEDENSAQKLLE
jgi:hypothetical protein